MSAVLRIEDTLRQIPPVSLIQNAPARNATAFAFSDRNTLTLNDGRIQETFTIFAQSPSGGNAEQLRNRVRQLDSLFKQQFQEAPAATNAFYLIEATDGERERRAFIYTASVAPLHDAILLPLLTNSTRTALYTLVLERGPWEIARTVFDKKNMSVFGGNRRVPDVATNGDAPGRISRAQFGPTSGNYIKRIWAGIKPAYIDIAEFDPEIDLTIDKVIRPETSDAVKYTPASTDPPTVGSEGIRVPFKAPSDVDGKNRAASEPYESWRTRFSVPLYNWNTNTATARYRKQYVGRYRVLLRWRSDAESDRGQRYGIRLSVGYGQAQRSVVKEVYPTGVYSIDRNTKRTAYALADMGEITIGGDVWGNLVQSRVDVNNFTLHVHAKLIVPSSVERPDDADDEVFDALWGSMGLIFDAIYLVPAEHFCYFEVPYGEVGADQTIDVYVNEDETYTALVQNRREVFDITTPNYEYYSVQQRIESLELNNWAMPPYEGSRLIVVGERKDGANERTSNNAVNVICEVRPRVRNYGGGA